MRAYAYDLIALYRWLHTYEKSLVELENTDLLAFIDSQQQRDIHPHSINRRLMTIRSYYRFSTGKEFRNTKGSCLPSMYYKGRGRDRFLGLNSIQPSKHRLLQVKTPRTLVEPLSKKQVIAFLETLVRYRDLCIVYLMLLCGLRSQEVLNVNMQDVCFEENRIRIHGKGNKERILPLPVPLVTILKRYLSIERPRTCQTTSLFVVLQGARKGQSMTPAGLRSLFRHRRQLTLLSNANAHRWRHTFGADMARAGIPLPILQRLMGHSDPRVTLQYINLSMRDIAKEFRRVSDEIHKHYTQL